MPRFVRLFKVVTHPVESFSPNVEGEPFSHVVLSGKPLVKHRTVQQQPFGHGSRPPFPMKPRTWAIATVDYPTGCRLVNQLLQSWRSLLPCSCWRNRQLSSDWTKCSTASFVPLTDPGAVFADKARLISAGVACWASWGQVTSNHCSVTAR